jgi:phage-Barnase-EndoU-ColicinE5/D-RelE like nuclease3
VYSLSNNIGLKVVDLGNVPENIVRSAKKSGIDVKGFNILITSYGVRHAFKKHGIKSVSVKNGEIPICVFDIILLPQIIKEGTLRENQDKSSLILVKQNFGILGEIVFEFVISKYKGNRLVLQTIYNKKRSNKLPLS